MNSSERRLKLILTLQSNEQMNARELAEKFGVSRRTIFRDLKVLEKMNVPVTWDKYSGYGIMRGYNMPPIMFNSQELATIMVGLSFARSQVDEQLAGDAEDVALKIKNVLPRELKEFMNSLENRTIVDPFLHYGSAKKKGGNWYLIASAISQQKRISFTYDAKSKSRKKDRKIDPYLLVFYMDHWNVIGRSHLRDSPRNFVLDRMTDIQILDEIYTLNDELDPESLIFRSEGNSHVIVLEVDKDTFGRFSSNLPAKIIKKTEVDSKIIKVTFRFDNLTYINEWLLQYSDNIKICEPAELKKIRASLLKKMLDD